MSEQPQPGASPLDTAKLIAAVAIMIGGMAGFYYLDTLPIWARWLVVLAALAAGVFVALQSHQGRTFGEFVQGSRIELRKVVWRDRDAPPTIQVALLVFVVVALMTLFFWGLDAVLALLVRWMTQRGS
jgi:preprotein translocase subunit SecE